ncbi:MAG: PAAR domain-containing protein, partial [Leadbetterella sp.]
MPAAARIGDMHICPMTEGVNPHVGGPIGPSGGSQNVFIGGMPAALEGGMCTCA